MEQNISEEGDRHSMAGLFSRITEIVRLLDFAMNGFD
jgi:hypothetical protein